jgi:hypothetical protein
MSLTQNLRIFLKEAFCPVWFHAPLQIPTPNPIFEMQPNPILRKRKTQKGNEKLLIIAQFSSAITSPNPTTTSTKQALFLLALPSIAENCIEGLAGVHTMGATLSLTGWVAIRIDTRRHGKRFQTNTNK